MRIKTIMLALGTMPLAMAAQETAATVQSSSAAQVSSESGSDAMASLSADARARLEITLASARRKNLPEEPIRNRIAEGRAKASSEAQIVAAAARLESRLDASQQAIVRGGRERPEQDEVARGANAMERGVTEAQIEALVRHAPSDRSLVVAFEVLSSLAARGVPVDQALAQIQSRLAAHASDESIVELATTASLNGALRGRGASQPSAAAEGSGAAGGRTERGAEIGVGLTGAVGVKVRKP